MKTYIKPTTETFTISAANMIAASGKTTETISKGSSGGNGVDLSREKQSGIGGGLWSDMQ